MWSTAHLLIAIISTFLLTMFLLWMLGRSWWSQAWRRFKLFVLVVTGLSLLGLFGWFVWPTPWRYDSSSSNGMTVLIRTHRVTSHSEFYLPPQGWLPQRSPYSPDPRDNPRR